MSEQIVPKRFGLKYSPKPAIALEYQKPDSGIAVLEVFIEKLSPRTCDVKGVVDALQKKHPFHLGPNMVSANQLERLVSRLLFEGRAHLPEEYPTPTGMIVDETQQQISSSSSPLRHGSPTKPSLQPKPEGYDSDHSGGLSRGPTPAPTPDMQRATRDLSDVSSEEASNPVSPRGDRFDDLGGEGKTGIAGARQAGGNDGKVEQQPSAAAAASTAAAAAAARLAEENTRGRAEEKEEVVGGEESLSREEDDSERWKRERKEHETEQAHGGARDKTEEELLRGKTEASSSLTGSPSFGPDGQRKLLELHETLEKGHVFDGDGETDDENEDDDHHGNDEGKVEGLPPSPTTAITAATATTLEEELDLKSPPGEPLFGENDSDKEELEEGEEEEEEIPEIEEEDDDVPEDVKTEELEEVGSRSSQAEGTEHPANDGSKEMISKEDGSNKGADDTHTTDNLADATFASDGDVGTAAERMGAVDNKDNHKEDGLSSSRVTEREAGGLDSRTPTAASRPPPSPTPAPPTAPAPAPTVTSPASGEGDTSLSLSSNLAPSRVLASASSPPLTAGGGGTSSSSLAGLPLPPMGGARPRLGLLGSLPPVGGRGLPSLALPVGKKTYNAGEEGDSAMRTACTGDPDDDVEAVTKVTDTVVSASPSPPLSSGLLLGMSTPRSSTAEKGPAAAAASELRLFRTPTTRGGSGRGTNDDNGNDDGGDDSGLEDPAPLSPIRGVEGQEKKEEEAAFRARLGLGEDEGEDEEDNSGGEIGEGSMGGRGNTTSSPPDSPKQHQGQEEENAGRISPADLRSKEDVESPVGGGGGADYFGDSDEAEVLGEVSSVDEDISFEQESVNSGGGGDGTGSDDYFS